ncbi:MAG: hypothetical protein J6P93_04630 [Alphaproteobacteria bacterium]|nr:hypothetical protein [Alphaproteobacteria bacterium]
MKKTPFSFSAVQKKAWLLTLLDLMMLMLTFFILLYSMSTPTSKITKKEAFFENIHFDEYPVHPHGIHLNYLEQILAQKIKGFDGYRLYQKNGMLYVQIPQNIFEDVDKRIIFEKDKKHIQSLGEQLNNISNKIFLQVSSNIQPTQEALLQASVVANLLKQGGYPFNLRIVQRDDTENDYIQIVIFPNTREDL